MSGIEFEWDRKRAASNFRKHSVGFGEPTTVFNDPLSITVRDPDHSAGEDRFVIIGMSVQHRLLVVVHTDRGERIRLVSARPATKHERRNYEEAQTSS